MIVTLKAMVWETKAWHSQAQMKETPNSNGCVYSGDEVSQRVMTKKHFG